MLAAQEQRWPPEMVPLGYVRSLSVQHALYLDALTVGAQMRPLTDLQLASSDAAARERALKRANKAWARQQRMDCRVEKKRHQGMLGAGCELTRKAKSFPAAWKFYVALRRAGSIGGGWLNAEQALSCLPGLRHHKRNHEARAKRATGLLLAICAAGLVEADARRGGFRLAAETHSVGDFTACFGRQCPNSFSPTKCLELAIRRILRPRKVDHAILRGVGGRPPAFNRQRRTASSKANNTGQHRAGSGRFARKPISPADGERLDVAPVGKAAQNAAPELITVIGGKKMSSEKPHVQAVGPRHGESWPDYLRRAAAEGEARARGAGSQEKALRWPPRCERDDTQRHPPPSQSPPVVGNLAAYRGSVTKQGPGPLLPVGKALPKAREPGDDG